MLDRISRSSGASLAVPSGNLEGFGGLLRQSNGGEQQRTCQGKTRDLHDVS
jgi:hypothetical protein